MYEVDETLAAPPPAKAQPEVQIYGIRHHGPGSARSLVQELTAFQPDCLLVEGPPEAESCVALALEPGMEPPVALLSFIPDQPQRAIYHPFAEYSPEWQAIRHALAHGTPLRFMDMPLVHAFGLDVAKEEELRQRLENTPPGDAAAVPPQPDEMAAPRRDPLGWLAEAAGFGDGERWWEHMVEQRVDGEGVFLGILEAMTALRDELPPIPDPEEQLREDRREAFMRTALRKAMKEFGRIAVVCGAWHAPALVPENMPKVKDDRELTKGLPKAKVKTTWIPWTNTRLTFESGYSAGIDSPGWYEHLWLHRESIAEHWLTLVARLLREEGLDASSAQVIDAVRTAESLAALRGHPLPGLPELEDACQALLCFGGSAPLAIIRRKLMVGEALGSVPEAAPLAPLMADLQRLQKRLRFPPKATRKTVTLDLRKENDLARSWLLHRLHLLGIPWGEVVMASGKGTFKEAWQTEWKPEFAIRLIEQGAWGNSVQEATEAYAVHVADETGDLDSLTELIGTIFLAELPAATAHAVQRLQDEAALAVDITHLMRALPPLVNVMRYGNVRQTDADLVGQVVDGMAARICVGLPMACGSLNDDAAAEMLQAVGAVDESLRLLQAPPLLDLWRETLQRSSQLPRLNGLVGGRMVRLLLDGGALDTPGAAQRFSLGLSDPDPPIAANWVQGFLAESGIVLIHDDSLWQLVHSWVAQLSADAFEAVLPLVRRTFADFPAGERRQLSERAKAAASGAQSGHSLDTGSASLHGDRAAAVLPILATIFGLEDHAAGDAP
ncbi:MAG: hypothetical protein HN904_15480 [Victivallales bacterium]|nr:hypothetical protein [Victivallales bacterium]